MQTRTPVPRAPGLAECREEPDGLGWDWFLARLPAGAQATWTLLGPRQGLGTGSGVQQRGLLCAGPSSGSGVGPPVSPLRVPACQGRPPLQARARREPGGNEAPSRPPAAVCAWPWRAARPGSPSAVASRGSALPFLHLLPVPALQEEAGRTRGVAPGCRSPGAQWGPVLLL